MAGLSGSPKRSSDPCAASIERAGPDPELTHRSFGDFCQNVLSELKSQVQSVDHAPILDDFPVLATPPIAVTHVNACTCRFNSEESLDMNASDLRPAAQKGVVPVCGLAA